MPLPISQNLKTLLIFAAIIVLHAGVALYLLLPRGNGADDRDANETAGREPPAEVEDEPEPEEPPEPAYETYVVQRNDNLTFIARRYGTTVAELQELNNLTNDRIVIGQELRVPARPDDTGNGE